MSKRIFTLCLALMVTGFTVSLQAAQQITARVVKLQGAARYSNGSSVWLPIKVGTMLKPGAVIQTASESSVDILLSGEETLTSPLGNAPTATPIINKGGKSGSGDALQNVVRLQANTLMAIDKLTSEKTGADTVTDTQLDLRSGTIFGNVKKSAAASRYEVKLPNGVAGIRGTIYSISAGGVITVYVGSVVLTFINPADPTQNITKVINSGQQYDLNVDVFRNTPPGGREEAQRQADEMCKVQGYDESTYFVSDHSVIYVSPVIGEDQPGQGPPGFD